MDLPAGDLTYGKLFEALPFENRVAVISLTGETLEELVLALLNSGHGFPQVSGLSITHAGVARCGGKRLDPKKTYTVATNDFLAAGGDGLRPIIAKIPKKQVVINDELSVRDAFAAWLKKPASERASAPCP